MKRVYVQTNDATANELVAFSRNDDGELEEIGRHPTGGRGTGKPHLPSQGSIAVAAGGTVLVANAGSADIAVFEPGLASSEIVASGGSTPTSIAVHGTLVYVLNAGAPASVNGFRLAGGSLEPIVGSERRLSSPDADPAQVAFSPDGRSLVVTERATDSITTFAVGEDGLLDDPVSRPSAGRTPYGFDFTPDGTLVVTEAAGGEIGAASASTYTVAPGGVESISRKIGNTRSEVCWAAVTKDGRHAYVTNFGDGTISSYAIGADGSLELREAVAATTVVGMKGVRDEGISGDGRFLYALDADSRQVFGWAVGEAGELRPVGTVGGLPETVAGLVAI
jgi:6-phosphogluconolactonase (cycloisomerase 2 family)